MASKKYQSSPLTGVLEEDRVVVDFGEHEGKSVFEINVEVPDYYRYLLDQKEQGNFYIKRSKDKVFKLYIQEISHSIN